MMAMVAAWKPDRRTWISPRLLRAQPLRPGVPHVGWLTWVPGDQSNLVDPLVVQRCAGGSLLRLGSSPGDVEAADVAVVAEALAGRGVQE